MIKLKRTFAFNKPVKLSSQTTLCTDIFHLQGTNYFIFTCLTCGAKKVEKGVKTSPEWGELYD